MSRQRRNHEQDDNPGMPDVVEEPAPSGGGSLPRAGSATRTSSSSDSTGTAAATTLARVRAVLSPDRSRALTDTPPPPLDAALPGNRCSGC